MTKPKLPNGSNESDWMIVHHAVGVVMDLSSRDEEYGRFDAIVSRGDIVVTIKHIK